MWDGKTLNSRLKKTLNIVNQSWFLIINEKMIPNQFKLSVEK